MIQVVVTGGGTIAPIDDVRFLANRSTGGLAARITETCLDKGATVWHIATPAAQKPYHRAALLNLDDPSLESELSRVRELAARYRTRRDRLHVETLPTGTVAEYAATLERILRQTPIDLVFLAMAVSDFLPEPTAGKISSNAESLTISCRPSPKVIRSVRDWAPRAYLVGFKLLSHVPTSQLIEAARNACAVNRVDLTVANDMQTIRDGRHTLHLTRPSGSVETLGPDQDIAVSLVDRVFRWRSENQTIHS